MSTSARLLRLLSLLQHNLRWSGPALAARLEVSDRTLRRDIERLRSLGYAIASDRGHDGGYQLTASASLPPLLLEADEVVALVAGLHAAAHGVDQAIAASSVSALAKVVAMLPADLRRRAEAVRDVTESGEGPPPWYSPMPAPSVLGAVAQACRDSVRLRFEYATFDGVRTERCVEPLRLVTVGRRWYLVAFDLDRQDWRTFRVDRVERPDAARNSFPPRRPPARDLAAYVTARLGQLRDLPERRSNPV